MTRSVRKGPFVDVKVMKKINGKKPGDTGVINIWARRSQIAPEMIGFTFGVHNGKTHSSVLVTEEMIGHRFGEFAPTKRFTKHGGKLQKAADDARKRSEIDAAKSTRVEK